MHSHSRTAGTVGAVVTCPLEVVKTRLQSSTAFITTTQRSVDSPGSSNGANSELLRPEQRRKLSTTILRNRSQPQVIGGGVRRVVPFYFLKFFDFFYLIRFIFGH